MEKKLAGKLVSILKNMAAVPKKGYNKAQNYHYMREVDVLEALKTELIENQVVLLTSSELESIEKKDRIDKHTGNTVVEFLTTVKTTHTFLDAETGEQYSITSVGSGIDGGDKSAAKAITSATKYAIVKTFLISDEGADIENDGVSKQEPATKTVGFSKRAPGNTTTTVATDTSTKVAVDNKDLPKEPIAAVTQTTTTPPAAQAPIPVKRSFGPRTPIKTEPNF